MGERGGGEERRDMNEVSGLSYLHETLYSLSWSHNNRCHDSRQHPGLEMLHKTASHEAKEYNHCITDTDLDMPYSTPPRVCKVNKRGNVILFLRELLIGCLYLQLLANTVAKETE